MSRRIYGKFKIENNGFQDFRLIFKVRQKSWKPLYFFDYGVYSRKHPVYRFLHAFSWSY